MIESGDYGEKFFNSGGELRNIRREERRPRSLEEALTKKPGWDEKEAVEFARFLQPMLALDPRKRATAKKCLKHPFLKK